MSDAILVLGASGFIGRHLAEILAAAGHPVIAATRKPAVFSHPNIANVVEPYTEPTHFSRLLIDCCWVIHAASATTPGSSAADPRTEMGAIQTILALLDALQVAETRRPLLYLSSGGTLYGDCDCANAHEQDQVRPRSYHGAGKATAELFIRAWAHQFNGTAVILRPSNVYGPGQPARAGFGIIPTALERTLTGSPLTIWGDGSAVRDYLHVDDLTRLCYMIITQGATPGTHIYNASRGAGVSLSTLLDTIDAVTGRILDRRYEANRRIDIQHIVPDSGAACASFGWHPQITLDEGLQQTWHWFCTRP